MKQLRVLGIAPYEGMKTAMASVAMDYPQIDLTIFVGDLEQGVEIARDNFHGNYDVVISRGGTAKLLQKHLAIPVVEVEITVYDLLCALKFAGREPGRIAIVSYADITESARLLGELMDYDIDAIALDPNNNAETALLQVRERGYSVVLCDMIANTIAKRIGLDSFLIVSGHDSIRQAFDRALLIFQNLGRLKSENTFLRELIERQLSETVVFDKNGGLFLSTLSDAAPRLLDILRQEIGETLQEGDRRFTRIVNTHIYSVSARRVTMKDTSYAAFFFTARKSPLSANQTGIGYFTRPEVEKNFYDSVFSFAGIIQDYQDLISHVCRSRAPVIIFGESGTCKQAIAQMLYLQSEMKNRSFVRIDCSILNERGWNFLVEHPSSPLANEGNLLYFPEIDALPPESRDKLVSILTDMDVCRRDRVIFSCTCPSGEQLSEIGSHLANQFSCLSVPMAPLRNAAERIPALVNLALNHLNADLPKQIMGVEPAGMELLKCFPWPYNHLQFCRVVNALAVTSPSSVITAKHVAQALDAEQHAGVFPSASEHISAPLDLRRPLSEITRDIASRVVEENGGNQTAAARQLGISRTTLWRFLKSGT